ncbi:MAG: phosphoadenylyl-sulfate reductase [Ginsengibacter sp.]
MKDLKQLEEFLRNVSVEEGLRKMTELYPSKIKFSSSLGQEDQVLTDIISRNAIDISIFTLDTGRLFNETYELIEKTEACYKRKIEIYFPRAEAVEKMVNERGINLFYNSVEERKLCCNVRKVEPLNRALEGVSVWVTGLRSSQTALRHDLPVIEWLADKQLYKYNPLLHWSYDQVIEYIKVYSVPYNTLHDKGFVSIGCAPCTRAIEPGEDARAGRWWWETSQKECGLHINK